MKTFEMQYAWQATFESLTDEEAGQLIKHLFRYVNGEITVIENRLVNIAFMSMKDTLPMKTKQPKTTEKTLNAKARETFEKVYQHIFDNTYYWTAKDAGQMANLLKKLIFQIRQKKGGIITDDEVISALDLLLNNIHDRWIMDNYSVTTITSRFNEIVSQIKTYGAKKTIRPTAEQDERAFIEAVINGAGRAEYERNQRLQRANG